MRGSARPPRWAIFTPSAASDLFNACEGNPLRQVISSASWRNGGRGRGGPRCVARLAPRAGPSLRLRPPPICSTPVKEILSGKSFRQPLGGMVGVAGVGRDAWLGSPLALANLYAFGRLAWDPNLTPEQIADEWTRQTISNDPDVVRTVEKMLMQSWQIGRASCRERG